MAINYTHKDNLGLYVSDNIEAINTKISDFKKTNATQAVYDDIDIKDYLKNKLAEELPAVKNAMLAKFAGYGFQKNKIVDVANEFVFYKKDIENIFVSLVFEELQSDYGDAMCNEVTSGILNNSTLSDEKKRFIKKDLSEVVRKSTYMITKNGFQVNLNNINSGVMTANAGDSAQFLFVSRAILAGYNCSNVDVRSSRYDAVIDYKGMIFKVQVKGISGSTVSFKDRDRGGRGIDTHNERNIGKRITAKDCDIYVAVDKQVGLCYIIPMVDIDEWDDDAIKSVNVKQLEQYLENWNEIQRLYKIEREKNR